MTSPEALAHGEALALGAAMLDRLTREAGVRMLLIKGPASEHHRLRRPRQSADVDILVEPSGFSSLLPALEALGWRRKDDEWGPQLLPHSATFRRASWPIELDVHYTFPGFLAPPAGVFDELWGERISLPIAGRDVPATGPLGSVLVHALHALREMERSRNQSEYAFLVSALPDLGIPFDPLLELARHTGSATTLAPMWSALGIEAVHDDGVDPDQLSRWDLRTESAGLRVVGWLTLVRTTPVRAWPSLLSRVLRAIWPPDDVMIRKLGMPLPEAELRRYRWLRIRAGLRDLPRALWLVWKHRG